MTTPTNGPTMNAYPTPPWRAHLAAVTPPRTIDERHIHQRFGTEGYERWFAYRLYRARRGDVLPAARVHANAALPVFAAAAAPFTVRTTSTGVTVNGPALPVTITEDAAVKLADDLADAFEAAA